VWAHGVVSKPVLNLHLGWCLQVASLSILAAFHGIVAVYFKENYNLFVTNTTHTILGPTVGFLLLLKAALSYHHYKVAKQVLAPACSVAPPACLATKAKHIICNKKQNPPSSDLCVDVSQTIKDSIDCIRTLAVHINSYGVVKDEDQARSIIKTYADIVS